MIRGDRPSHLPAMMIRRAAALALVVAFAAAGLEAEDDAIAPGRLEGEDQAAQEDNVVDLGANFDSNLEHGGGGFVVRPGDFVGPGRIADGGGAEWPPLARVRAAGDARLAEVERACTPSAEQRRKLEFALEADIRRCVAEIAAIRSGYAGQTVNLRERDGQQRWQRFQQDVQRCRRLLAQPFGERSLFAESLPTVLDAAQMTALTTETAARRSFRWKSYVVRAMLRLDDALALTQEQHDEIERMLLEQEPNLRLDARSGQRNEHAEQMLVFMMLTEVDQKKLKAVVGEDRWKATLTLANQGRSMRSWIEGEGLIEPRRR